MYTRSDRGRVKFVWLAIAKNITDYFSYYYFRLVWKVLCIALIRSKFECSSAVWNNLTLADSNKVETIQRKFANLCYNRFIHLVVFVIINQCWTICILKCFIPDGKILTLYFVLTFSRTKLTVLLSWILLVSVYPLKKSETFPPLKSVISSVVGWGTML
jgi:hypothetical protein